jgi:hypothetical protein
LHCIVTGAGLDAQGRYVVVKDADYILPADAQKRLRHHFGEEYKMYVPNGTHLSGVVGHFPLV